jgi:DNA-binding NtrC family response regulator
VFADRNIEGNFTSVPDEILPMLERHAWQGNLRELWNLVQRAFDYSRGSLPVLDDYARAFEGVLSPDVETRAIGMLERLSDATVRDSASFLRKLVLRELSLLYSALELTRDPVSGAPSRAKAAALLKGKPRASTNDFDRWVERLLDRLPSETANEIQRAYPDLLGARSPGPEH